MQIIRSALFENIPNIIFGMSTKIGLNREAPFYFNMSMSVGDNEKTVTENRKAFFSKLGLNLGSVVLQKQIHSDIVTLVHDAGKQFESDALITDKPDLGLAISTADCVPVFLYDKSKNVIGAVHSGWRGTAKNITSKTLQLMQKKFGTVPNDLFAFIGPSIAAKNYEVSKEVAQKFDDKYLSKKNNGKYLLDLKMANYDMLINFGIPANQIEVSGLCSFEEKKLLHSYRRDGKKSGRALGIIAMRNL